MQIFAPAVRDESVEREWGRESFPPSMGVFCVQNDVYQITLLEIDGSVFCFFLGQRVESSALFQALSAKVFQMF